jgi:2-oxoglutarate ferredoxin oxidoreductase subunit gamma
MQPNVLVCLTQAAYNKFYPAIRPGGLLITDTRHVKAEKKVDAQQKELAMYETIMEEIGKPIVFNICMLGAVIQLTNVVKPNSVLKILEKRIPADFLEMNRKALNIGIKLGEAATA